LIEANGIYQVMCLGEPQLGRRGLYPTLSQLGSGLHVQTMMNILAYADGQRDVVSLAERIGVSAQTCLPIIATLLKEGLLKRID
jgi:aminopeptidase-like protein